MYQALKIKLGIQSKILSLAVSWYGNRIAVCSSDGQLKIFDKQIFEQHWVQTASFKADAFAVEWAHPEFGNVLATCSHHHIITLWEEADVDSMDEDVQECSIQWIRKINLEKRSSVTDIKFAPNSQGLQLAACSKEGVVTIYKALNSLNLDEWCVVDELDAKVSLSHLSWNPNTKKNTQPIIAVGSDDVNLNVQGKVILYEYSISTRKWLELEVIKSLTEPVHWVEFSPNLGKPFSILAVGTNKDIRLISLTPQEEEDLGPLTKLSIKTIAQFNNHNGPVWKVCFNMCGTMLLSSGADGRTRLFQTNHKNEWGEISSFAGAKSNSRENSQNLQGSGDRSFLGSLGEFEILNTSFR